DSIERRALMRDPLAYRALDGALLAHVEGGATTHVAAVPGATQCYSSGGYTQVTGNGGELKPGTPLMINRPTTTCTQTDHPVSGGKPNLALQGWGAYSVQQFPAAIVEYTRALSDTKVPWAIHAERARIFYLGKVLEKADTDFALAASALRANKNPDL